MSRHLAEAFYSNPWALHLPKLREIEAVIRARFFVQRGAGRPKRLKAFAPKAPTPAAGPNSDKPYPMFGRVAVLRMFGVISMRMNLFSDISGGTSTEVFGRKLDAAIADNEVRAIVFDVDSPGGSVAGVPELAQRIFDARRAKRIVAVCNPLMASAAYWLSSQAHEIVMTPSGYVGSIGVYLLHEDYSQALEKAGIKPTYVFAGRYKVEGNDSEPLNDEAKANWQSIVDDTYSSFIEDVARGRGVNVAAVRDGYGQGRVLNSQHAIGAGLVNRVATLDQVLADENNRNDGNPFGSAAAAMARQRQLELEL